MSFEIFAGFCPYCSKHVMETQWDAHMEACEAQEAELHRQQQLKPEPSNVRVLPGSPIPGNDPVPEVVDYLEKRLAEARRGEIRAIATCSVSIQGGISTGWINNGNFWKLIGGIDWLKHRMHSGEE